MLGRPANFWGELIRRLREEREWPQRALADLAEVPRATVRRIELGATPGTIDQIEALLEVLGYDLDAIRSYHPAAPKVMSRLLLRIEDPNTPQDLLPVLRARLTLLNSAPNCKTVAKD